MSYKQLSTTEDSSPENGVLRSSTNQIISISIFNSRRVARYYIPCSSICNNISPYMKDAEDREGVSALTKPHNHIDSKTDEDGVKPKPHVPRPRVSDQIAFWFFSGADFDETVVSNPVLGSVLLFSSEASKPAAHT